MPGRRLGSGEVVKPRDVLVVSGPAHPDAEDDIADRRNDTVKWATGLAETVRAQVRPAPEAGAPH